MTQQFTANEVRDEADFGGDLRLRHKMLYAYADRLEADEKAMPTGFVSAGSLLALQSCRNDEYNGTVNLWMRPNEAARANVPLYTHPQPAQDAKDAARYRWLRDAPQELVEVYFATDKNPTGWGDWNSWKDKDAGIDTHMAKESGR